jgi:hypothetical protein
VKVLSDSTQLKRVSNLFLPTVFQFVDLGLQNNFRCGLVEVAQAQAAW